MQFERRSLSIALDTYAYTGVPNLRLMAKPVAVPQATGSSIATAGFSKTKLGRVSEGM
jgi:hypothetical protein